jgi:hypothetical protein
MSGVAIAAAVVGAAVAIGTAAASGAEASKSKKAAREAEKVASRKLEEARKEIQRMPMQELSLDLSGYKNQQEVSQVAAAQAIDAAQQGEGRGLAATMGRVQMADIERQRNARLDKSVDLQRLEELKATERAEASDKLAGLNLAEAEGAQQAAADADKMAGAYTSQAIQSGMQAVQGVVNVAGAVMAPKMEMGAAYDKNLAGMNEADLKSYIKTRDIADQPAVADIDAMTAAELRDWYVNSGKVKSEWMLDPDWLKNNVYTPQSQVGQQ